MAVIWVVTVALGMVLRNLVFDRGTAASFIIVTSVFTFVLLFGWRLLYNRVLPAALIAATVRWARLITTSRQARPDDRRTPDADGHAAQADPVGQPALDERTDRVQRAEDERVHRQHAAADVLAGRPAG